MGNVSSPDLWLHTAAEQLAGCSLQHRVLHWDVLTLIYALSRTAAGILVRQAIFNYSNFPSSAPTLLVPMKLCATP